MKMKMNQTESEVAVSTMDQIFGFWMGLGMMGWGWLRVELLADEGGEDEDKADEGDDDVVDLWFELNGVSMISSSSHLFLGDQVILFSFLSLRLALANHVDTWVSVIWVIMANIIFSALVGYGFFLCSFNQALSVEVVSRVAFLRRDPLKSIPRNIA